MYRERSILDSDLFKVFFYKLFKSRALLKYRMELSMVREIGERLSFREVSIPHENIQLIYGGYDSTVMFETDASGASVSQVWRGHGNDEFRPEPFIGYPVFYDYRSDTIEQGSELTGFLKKHWSAVKGGYPCHGDMTHYNLLVDSAGRIRSIDAKPHNRCGILTDLFYFYAFFRYSLDKHIAKGTVQHQKLIDQLGRIYRGVFADDCSSELAGPLSEIHPAEIGNEKVMRYMSEFNRVISGRREGK